MKPSAIEYDNISHTNYKIQLFLYLTFTSKDDERESPYITDKQSNYRVIHKLDNVTNVQNTITNDINNPLHNIINV